ncbi:MAG TPA: response regulator [Puia sp.]|jgi:two-component system chemotaxis response regulator CheY
MRGKSILLVDDSNLIRSRLQSLLKTLENPGPVREAADYHTALRLIADTPPDIILLDINLPGKNGIDLLRHIKIHYPQIIVIMLTNQNSDHYKAVCQKWGADYFMDKSKDFEQVPTLISSLL